MEETITLTEIFAALIRAWKQIVITMLVFACLFGGMKVCRNAIEARDPENSEEAIEERYQKALDQSEEEKTKLEEQLAADQEALASSQEYQANSILIKIDPYNEYVTTMIFAVTEIDETASQAYAAFQNTSAGYLYDLISSQYAALWQSIDIPEELDIGSYRSMDEKYLSEVISVSRTDGGFISIRVMMPTAQDAELLANAVYRFFQSQESVIGKSACPHKLFPVNQTTKCVIDESLLKTQEDLAERIESLQESVESLQQSLDEWEEPEREAGYSVKEILSSGVKFAVLGAVLGAFLACFCVFCSYAFGGRMISSYQMEHTVGAPFFGSLRLPDSRMERLANAVIGERVWPEQDAAAAYVSGQVHAALPEGGKLLLLSTLPEKTAGEGLNAMQQMLAAEGYEVSRLADAAHAPSVMRAIQGCAAVLCVEAAGSRLTVVKETAARVRSRGKPVLGFVMI